MKLQTLIFFAGLWLICYGCDNRSIEGLSVDKINEILSNVNEEDPEFVIKDVVFDSVATLAGTRTLNGQSERIKARLYYYGDRTRGYFNLADRDDKNLQVFGRKVEDQWAIKCVTKLNMEEVGGYIILGSTGRGIWANGHYNFQKEEVTLTKQKIDYDALKSW